MSARNATPPSLDAFAQRMQSALIARIGAQRFHLWFQHTAFIPMGRELVVAVLNAHTQDWLSRTFGDAIREAAAEALGAPTPIKYVVDEQLFDVSTDKSESAKAEKPNTTTKPDRKKGDEEKVDPQLNLFGERHPLPAKPKRPTKPNRNDDEQTGSQRTGRRFKTLNDFVVGPSNRVVHASALSVVEDPGMGANPLVIHGPVGTGKTHLLEGIYAGFRRQYPDLRPSFVTAEEFTTRFVQSSRFNKQGGFRRQFRDCGALLIDDIHFLATKRLTQEEFLHTFDSVIADGRQVVVTMDCHPRLAEELMPELVDRLLGGAVWGLLPPDDETRLEILRKKSTGSTIPEDVLKFLARNLRGNVRELEGAVNSIKHFGKVTSKPITQSLVREALGDLLRHTVRAITVADVDNAVCSVLRLSSGTLQSKARSWAVSHPRMLAIYLARKHTSATYGEISKHFGAKTHSTSVAAEKKVRTWIAKDEPLALGDREWRTKDVIDRIERELQR